MKKNYCEFCGLELENGLCNCEEFIQSHATKKRIREDAICDTCKKRISSSASYCPYCGIPIAVNGHIEELQEDLKGSNAVDVLSYYREEDKKKKHGRTMEIRVSVVVLMSLVIILLMSIVTASVLVPYIKKRIADEELRRMLENDKPDYNLVANPNAESLSDETTKQPVLSLKDMWVRQDGYFYAFDKNGDPVIEDWVTEVDEDGNEKKYYFDVDGRLVVNSWIDGEYYVGSDGAMLKDQDTPDGAHVDEDGRVILTGGEEVPVERETYVYYESPNSKETVEATNQKSSTTGEIKGVDPTKTYQLYVKNIYQERETIYRGDDRCNIVFFVPILAGANEKEVNTANEALKAKFAEFKEELINMAKTSGELPKSITFTTIEQRNVTSNRMNLLTNGKLIPRKGLNEKKKFRFVYDRKSKTVMMADISE